MHPSFWIVAVSVPLLLSLGACQRQFVTAAAKQESQPVLAGAMFNALSDEGVPLRFRVDSVELDPKDRDGEVRLYGVSLLDEASGAWHPYCLPDAEGRSAAIPVQGSWTANGEFEQQKDTITLACTSGAIGKCIRFGYKPWKVREGIALGPYHAACIRMVRADYCGDGRTHTHDRTQIDMWDALQIQTREETPDHPEVFEAAWGPAGAVYLNVPRWSDEVAEVVKECPAHFAGRTSASQKLTPAQVQEQYSEALIFNARFIRDEDRRK